MKIPLVDLKAQYLSIKSDIDKAIQRTLNESAFILGRDLEEFEKQFAKFCGVKYAVGVSSGATALDFALYIIGIKPEDEVITVPNTFVATVSAITHNQTRPVFVDIDPKTLNIDVEKIEQVITRKTRAIIVVHIYGNPADMKTITKIAKKHKLAIIEDASQAHGAKYQGKPVGSFGEIACFSLYPAKNLGAYGDAGIITTNNREFAQKAKLLRNHGRIKKDIHILPGYTARLDNLQAAILKVKLKKLNLWNRKRRKNARLYQKLLSNINGISIPAETTNSQPVYCYFVIRTTKRNQIKTWLEKRGISTSIYYPIPLHLQPAFRFLGYKMGDFPEAERASREILSLPMYPELAREQIDYIATQVKKFFGQQ